MITKEQALTCKYFRQIAYYDSKIVFGSFGYQRITTDKIIECEKPINWRANGQCKTWKTKPNDFHLPIKHGLRDYGYITQENAHLFEAVL